MIVEFVANAYKNPLASVEVDKNRLFAEGDIQDLPRASAERWIRRGIAVVSKQQPKKTGKNKRATKSV